MFRAFGKYVPNKSNFVLWMILYELSDSTFKTKTVLSENDCKQFIDIFFLLGYVAGSHIEAHAR